MVKSWKLTHRLNLRRCGWTATAVCCSARETGNMRRHLSQVAGRAL